MKIRPNQIAIMIIVLLGVLTALVVLRDSVAKRSDSSRALRNPDTAEAEGERLLQSVNEDGLSVPTIVVEVAKNATGGYEHDLGVISNKENTTGEVIVRNMGGQDLEITDVRTTCSCTKARFTNTADDKRRITLVPPGGQATMEVIVNPFRITGFHSHQILTLYSNDPDNPAVEVGVTANVDPEFELDPETLEFGTVEQGKTATAAAIVRQKGDKGYEVKAARPGLRSETRPTAVGHHGEAKSGSAVYTVALDRRPETAWASPEHAEWVVTATLTPAAPLGKLFDHVSLETTAPRLKNLHLRLSADVSTFYAVEPSTLTVRQAVAPGTANVATARITSRDPVEVTDICVSSELLTVVVEPGAEPGTQLLRLNVSPSAMPGRLDETISFKVRSGDKQAQHQMRTVVSVSGATEVVAPGQELSEADWRQIRKFNLPGNVERLIRLEEMRRKSERQRASELKPK